MKVLNTSQSLCDKCYKTIPAEIGIIHDKVCIKKKCKKHGVFTHEHVWDDVGIYKGVSNIKNCSPAKSAQMVINITNRCNLTCPICYAKANELGDLEFGINDFKKISDYKYIFLSGGEPTVREDLFDIIKYLKKNKQKVILLTNGLKLADERYVVSLKKAGVYFIILQFDGINNKDYEYLRGKSLLDVKKKALYNLTKHNVPVYLYAVALKNKNLNELKTYFNFITKQKTVKIISFNPIWRIGRYSAEYFAPTSYILKKLCKTTKLNKEDFIESTKFLCYAEQIFALFTKKDHNFSKCVINCLALHHKNRFISINKIFNLKKLNKIMEKIIEKKNILFNLPYLIVYSIFDQLMLNSLWNKNCQLFMLRLIKNLKYITSKNLLLINPFYVIKIATFPTEKDIDFNLVKTCNLVSISPLNYKIKPGCIFQAEILRKLKSKKRCSR